MIGKLKGIIDSYFLRENELPGGVDFLMMGTPVQTIVPLTQAFLPKLEAGCIVSDVGSVKGEIVHVRPGPVVTLYELEPAPGIKSSRVIGLADDIARSMSALSARVAVSDLDEIGQLGERFNLLTARLDETDRARRTFVSNISHELRTPLAIIRGHVEAQLAGGGSPVPPRETLETIDREARALGGLIDDLFNELRTPEDVHDVDLVRDVE